MKAGDWVLLPFPAANRDPAAFDRPDDVVIDRLENRHAAFGLGIHRCLGSNLARLELRVAIEEFLARIPEFELADPEAVVWSVGGAPVGRAVRCAGTQGRGHGGGPRRCGSAVINIDPHRQLGRPTLDVDSAAGNQWRAPASDHVEACHGSM